MANFECKVVKIDDKMNHPNADRLTIYKIGGYTCISNKLENGEDRYNVGDLVVYIPENAVLPKWLLEKMGFWDAEKDKGFLAGSEGNRVKGLKLRGIYSEGVLLPLVDNKLEGQPYGHGDEYVEKDSYVPYIDVKEGDNVAEFLGITKYEPPIPTSMGGDVFNGGSGIAVKFDVEPIQKYMNVLVDGEMVEASEKVHGTNCRYIFTKNNPNDETFGEDKDVYICSKGLGDKGLFFKNNESNINSYYVKAFIDNDIEKKVKSSELYKNNEMITVLCEVFGMQDLKYGLTNGQVGVRLFDVYVGKPNKGRFLNYEETKTFAEETGIERVPSLYVGPYSLDKIMEVTNGTTMVGTNDKQIREGVVIKPLNERFNDKLGRVMVKSVSEAYKLRKGNTTEYN